jgi:hypothetical protein
MRTNRGASFVRTGRMFLDANMKKIKYYWCPLKIWKCFQEHYFLGQPKCRMYICPIIGEKQQSRA